jgi:hypothetical protein
VINTWDRTPYLTTLRTGQPSLLPKYNNVSHNLFISNYNSFDGIDNDDGSSYYDISSNVFYLNEGLKSDYHGHGKLYHDNINIGAGAIDPRAVIVACPLLLSTPVSQWVAQPDFGRQIGIVAACWLPVLDLRRRLAASQKSDLSRPGGINQSPE